MRKQSCTGRLFAVLAGLISFVVLAALIGYAAAARICLSGQATESKLYNQFASQVRAKQGWRLYGGLGQTGVLLEPGAVAAWEPQYKDDPQYWQLRYWLGCAQYAVQGTVAPNHSAAAAGSAAGTVVPKAGAGGATPDAVAPDTAAQRQAADVPGQLPSSLLEPLRQAVAAGSADVDTLLLLYEGEIAAQDPAATVAQREPLLKLLDQAISYDPQLSWGYYLRAIHRLDALKGESVDWNSVRADLSAGNKAPRNARPLAFPHGYVESQIADGGKPAGGPVLAGAVLEYGALVQATAPLDKTVARAARFCLAHCTERSDTGLAGELQRALCRIAAVEETNPDEKLALSGPLRMMAYYIGVRVPYPPLWQQQEDSYQVQQWLNDAPFIARLICTEVEAERLSRLAPYAWLDVGQGRRQQYIDSTSDADLRSAEPKRVPAWVRYLLAYDLRLAEREQLYDRYQRLLANLCRFDLPRMQLPYDLSPVNRPRRLPPVIPTVEEARKMQQKAQAAAAKQAAAKKK
jgi:hypothetical protein